MIIGRQLGDHEQKFLRDFDPRNEPLRGVSRQLGEFPARLHQEMSLIDAVVKLIAAVVSPAVEELRQNSSVTYRISMSGDDLVPCSRRTQ